MCSAAAGLMIATAYVNYKGIETKYGAQEQDITDKIGLNEVKKGEALYSGRIAEESKRAETRKILGAQHAIEGASGLDTTSGTFQKLAADTAKAGELDARTIQRNAMMQAWGYEAENVSLRNKQLSLDKQEELEQWGSILGTGGKMLKMF